MPLPRSAPLRSLSRARPARTIPRSRTWQQTQRRGYADVKETANAAKDSLKTAAQKAKGPAETMKGPAEAAKKSDMPWLVGAVLVTIPASYFVAKSGPMTNPLNHPLPGDNYHGEHGEHDEEEHDDEEGGKEGEEGASEDGEKSEGGEGDDEAKSEDSDSDAQDKSSDDSSSDDGQDTPATSDNDSSSDDSGDDKSDPAPNEEKRTSQPGKTIPGASSTQEPQELDKGPDGQTRLLLPTAKGGNKKRIESSKGIVQGRSEEHGDQGKTSEEGSIGDVKDGSKSAVAGQTSSKQKGVSNTDTKHSIDQMKNPDASKKPEGVPDTAKIQGTVDPSRPAR